LIETKELVYYIQPHLGLGNNMEEYLNQGKR